jgi:hypothetical protein
MPSTSAKQHRFMQAIAHSPSFAKKAGVSQSVGKDFSAADKGKTFKKGDMMKKRYDNGGGVDFDADDDPESQKVFRDDDAGGLTELSDEKRMPRRSVAAPAAKPAAKKAAPKRGTPGHRDYFNAADPDMSVKGVRNTAAAEYKAAARNKYMEARGYYEASKNNNLSPAARGDMSKRYAKAMKDYDILGGGYKHASDKGLNKGGSIMESKKMMGKEMAFMQKKGAPKSMIKHEKAEMGMKKGGMAHGGMPMKDGKSAFMKKKMMGGGMAYAKGGGIESRGKTKGTVIRMAAGGSVSSSC